MPLLFGEATGRNCSLISRAREEFGPNALKTLRARNDRTSEWCRKTVNAAVTSVRTIFKWGVSEELVPVEVLARLASVQGLQRGRSEAHDPEPVAPVTDEQVDIVLPLVPRGVRGLIQFQRFTGARPGEAVALRMKDIDTSGETWTYKPTAHKNAWRGKCRTIAIGPRGKQLLEEYKPTNPNEPVFPTAEGTAYTVSGYRQAVERACDRAFPPPAPLAQREDETVAAWWARLSLVRGVRALCMTQVLEEFKVAAPVASFLGDDVSRDEILLDERSLLSGTPSDSWVIFAIALKLPSVCARAKESSSQVVCAATLAANCWSSVRPSRCRRAISTRRA